MDFLVFLSAALGLGLHSGLFLGRFRGLGMFRYYTNLSNLVIGVYSLLACWWDGLHHPVLWFSMTMGIFLTFLIYHFVLLPGFQRRNPGGWKAVDNLLVHYVTPWIAALNWMLFGEKSTLNGWNGLVWLLLPAAYLLFSFARAPFAPIEGGEKRYPYHFMDPDRIGWGKVVRNLVGLTLLCGLGTEVVILLISRLP